MWKHLYAAGIALLVLFCLLQIGDRWARRAPALPAVPQPNGYVELLKVTAEIRVPPREIAELPPAETRAIADANREPLERARQVLRMDGSVPLQTTNNWVESHEAEVKQLKRLAAALALQAQESLRSAGTNQAAEYYMDMIRLGQSMARGGIRSDGIHSLVVETLGTAFLRPHVANLDAEFSRQAARELESMESQREPAQRILETEENWSARSFGLVHLVGGKVMRESHEKRATDFLSRYNDTIRRTRLLMLALAARAVELETGEPPMNPSALVPAVLKTVPIDPRLNEPFTTFAVASQ